MKTTPHETLGVADAASDQEIRAAYLAKVKEFPPERSPEEFEKIRDAYDALRDPRQRFRAMLLSIEYTQPLATLFCPPKAVRTFTGPNLWREVLKAR